MPSRPIANSEWNVLILMQTIFVTMFVNRYFLPSGGSTIISNPPEASIIITRRAQ